MAKCMSLSFRLDCQVASDCFRVQGCEGPDHAAALRKELEAGLRPQNVCDSILEDKS